MVMPVTRLTGIRRPCRLRKREGSVLNLRESVSRCPLFRFLLVAAPSRCIDLRTDYGGDSKRLAVVWAPFSQHTVDRGGSHFALRMLLERALEVGGRLILCDSFDLNVQQRLQPLAESR